jgi:hypothetical protein
VQARRSSESAIAAEALMNNAGAGRYGARSMKRVPWQIGLILAAFELAKIGRITEYLRLYLAYEAGQSQGQLV